MLSLTTKKYEVEEKVEIKNEKEEVLYSFDMQITSTELNEIKKIIIDGSTKLSKIKDNDIFMKEALKMQERFEDICFKDNKEAFKKVDEYKYSEMVDLMYSFFINMFIEKRVGQVNTINTNLHKITKN